MCLDQLLGLSEKLIIAGLIARSRCLQVLPREDGF